MKMTPQRLVQMRDLELLENERLIGRLEADIRQLQNEPKLERDRIQSMVEKGTGSKFKF